MQARSAILRAVNEAHRTPPELEEAHDVLAAEAFAVPAADPVLDHHHPVVLPDDPSGIPDAHDILAAEEFAMPAPVSSHPSSRAALVHRARGAQWLLVAVLALGVVSLLLRRRRR